MLSRRSFSVVNILRGKTSSANISEHSPLLRFSQDDRWEREEVEGREQREVMDGCTSLSQMRHDWSPQWQTTTCVAPFFARHFCAAMFPFTEDETSFPSGAAGNLHVTLNFVDDNSRLKSICVRLARCVFSSSQNNQSACCAPERKMGLKMQSEACCRLIYFCNWRKRNWLVVLSMTRRQSNHNYSCCSSVSNGLSLDE